MASIEKRGEKYLVRYRDESGKQRAKRFDRYRDAKDFKTNCDSGNSPSSAKETVSDWMNQWYKSYASPPLVRPNTAADYKNSIKNHIIPAIGSVRLAALSKSQVQAFYNDLAAKINPRTKQPLKPKTIKNIHCALSQALDQAVEDRMIKQNPAKNTKRPKVIKRPPEPPAAEKMNELLHRIDKEKISAAIYACAMLGVRRGEALGATWSALDLKSHDLLISHQVTMNNLTKQLEFSEILKTDASYRHTPVPQFLEKKLLAERRAQKENRLRIGDNYTKSDFIFTDDMGKPLSPSRVSQAFKRCARSVGLPEMRLHSLRGAYASHLLANGVDIKTVQDLLGHVTPEFTMRVYAASLAKNRQEVATTVNVMYGDF